MSHGEYRILPILAHLPRDLNGLSVIDLGCGYGEVVYKMLAFSGKPWVHYHGKPASIWGVDTNMDYLQFLKDNTTHYSKLIRRNIEAEGLKGLGTHDLAICTEFLEHTHLAPNFLDGLKKMAKHVIVSVPYGFTNHKVDGIEEFNHKSGWAPKDFEDKGFKVTKYLKTQSRGRVLDQINDFYFALKSPNPYALYGLIATYDKGLSQ